MVDSPIIKLFQDSASSVLKSMIMADVTPRTPYLKEGNHTFGAVTAVIGMASQTVHATLAISFPEETIFGIFKMMLGDEIAELNDEVLDEAGELTNMICGDAKRRLSQLSISVEIDSPVVLSGTGVRIRIRVKRNTWVLPFETPAGEFVLETNMPE